MPKTVFVVLTFVFLYSLGAAGTWVILLDYPAGKTRRVLLTGVWIITILVLPILAKVRQWRASSASEE